MLVVGEYVLYEYEIQERRKKNETLSKMIEAFYGVIIWCSAAMSHLPYTPVKSTQWPTLVSCFSGGTNLHLFVCLCTLDLVTRAEKNTHHVTEVCRESQTM